MSFFSRISHHDPLLRLLGVGHGNHSDNHGHNDGDGLRFGYPMNPGDTLATIAGKLGIPVDELLTSNPSLRIDSPLTPGLDIALPTHRIDQLIDKAGQLNMPGSSNNHEPPPWSQGQTSTPSTPVDPPRLATSADGNRGNLTPANRNANALPGSSAIAPQAVADSTTLAPMQVPAGERSGYAVAIQTTGKSQAATLPVDTMNFGQAASTTIRMVQNQNDGSLPPPPLPQSAESRAMPLFNTSAMQTPWAPQATPSAWQVVVDNTGGNQARLQIMALLAAQIGGASISNGPATGHTPGFIDPQAAAAYANSMRAGRSINLGAGRSLQFSLAADPMRRVGAIGEEGRAVSVGSRRTGDGLDEVQDDVRTEADQETQDSHDDRQQERRRLAAIAAMRRRRRPLSTRCRYWRGQPRPLYASGDRRYPKNVDLAEFHSRRPQRYMWTTSPVPARPNKP